MNELEIGMKLKSSKTEKTYIVENISEVSNKAYLNCENDNEVAETHVLSRVEECLENGYYTIIKENKITGMEAINTFLANWKEKAREYYMTLYKEYLEERNKEYEINEENLKKLTYYAWEENTRMYSDEKINFILDEIKSGTMAKYMIENLESELTYQFFTKWKMKHTKSDIIIIERENDDNFEKILTKEVERKRLSLIARVEKVTGKIIDAENLYIANNLEINGYIVGEKATAQVETITAGGYNIQCWHYRVLVKKLKSA